MGKPRSTTLLRPFLKQGEALQRARQAKGWSQQYVAKKLEHGNVTRYQQWESGIHPPKNTEFAKLEAVLGVDPIALYLGAQYKSAAPRREDAVQTQRALFASIRSDLKALESLVEGRAKPRKQTTK